MPIKHYSAGFISVGDKVLPITNFTIDAKVVFDRIDESKCNAHIYGHSPLADLPNVVESTATVIEDGA